MTAGEDDGQRKQADPPVQLPKCSYAIEPPSPDEYGRPVDIVVGTGSEQRTFAVYEGLLKYYSTYFANALKDEWRNGKRDVVLEQDDPDHVRAFFHWITTGKLYSKLDSEGNIPLEQSDIRNIWIWADMRGIPELCNAAMDLLFQKCMQEWMYDTPGLQHLYHNTAEGATIRRFFVDWGLEKFGFRDIKKFEMLYPKAFLMDVMQEIAENGLQIPSEKEMPKTKYVHWKKTQICSKYHDHSSYKGENVEAAPTSN